MIDVIFLLLIYFVVSSTYTPPESELTPALRTERDAAGRSSDLTPQVVEVSREGAAVVYRVGAQRVTGRAELIALLRTLPRAPGVVVRGSDGATTEGAFGAIQACRDAGFDKVTYVPGR